MRSHFGQPRSQLLSWLNSLLLVLLLQHRPILPLFTAGEQMAPPCLCSRCRRETCAHPHRSHPSLAIRLQSRMHLGTRAAPSQRLSPTRQLLAPLPPLIVQASDQRVPAQWQGY